MYLGCVPSGGPCRCGDRFVFDLDFGGQRLSVTDYGGDSEEYLGWQFVSNPTGQSGFLWDTTFQFQGVEGDLLTNNFSIQFGGPIGAFLPNWNLTDTEFSFSGISLIFDVFYKEPGRPAFTTEQLDFNGLFNPDSGRFSVVPIPAAAWLFASALGLFGWIARNKDARTKRAIAA